MKRYFTLGELLIDYRTFIGQSQSDFAAEIDVDVRTVQRWENNDTLVKPEKEKEIVEVTLLPYQLIRNLNAAVPIATFYDFRINKYSLSKLNKELPKASWFKQQIENTTSRVRPLNFEEDFDYILKHLERIKVVPNNINQVIRESIKILPEMNLIITDVSGFYSGHSLIFPINHVAYERLKSKKMTENELSVADIINYKTQEKIILYGYDITADSNDNMFYIVNQQLRFIRDLPNQNYLYCSTALRYDTYRLIANLGLKIIWEEPIETNKLGLEFSRRFQTGNFRDFLK